MNKVIDISTHQAFPFHFKVLGIVFILISLILAIPNVFLSIPLFLLGLLFLTTHFRLHINLTDNKCKEYLWIMGFKKGSEFRYSELEFIYINKISIRSGYGFAARINIEEMIYKGFLKVPDHESLLIGESRKEEKLMKKIRKLSDSLNVTVKKNY